MSQDNDDEDKSPLDKALGLSRFLPEPIADTIDDIEDEPEFPVELIPADFTKADVHEQDVQFARDNLKQIIKTAKEASKDLIQIAERTSSSKVYEVAARFLEMATTANRTFADLALKRKQAAMIEQGNNVTVQNITNNLNVRMTTREAIKLAKEQLLEDKDAGKE